MEAMVLFYTKTFMLIEVERGQPLNSESKGALTRANTFTWGLDLSGTSQGAGGVGGLIVQTEVSGGVIRRASYDGNGNIVAWTRSDQSAPDYRRE